MNLFAKHFPLGLGTARFPVNGPGDTAGIEKSIQIVVRALESGIDYIDTGYNYSAGMAPRILKEAFRQTKRPFSITTKVAYDEDPSADSARRRVEDHLNALALSKADYFTCWRIWSYHDFEEIMKKGGVYEGALRLKDEGIVKHICCSLHAPAEDMVRILESGAFEGATISYSLLNAREMQPVLDAALRHDVGIAVMNPLGGGLIAENQDYFSFACGEGDCGNTTHAALRFVKAHPAVSIVLGGVSSVEELDDSLGLIRQPDPEGPAARIARVMKCASELEGYCTGCRYCAGCPQGIPTHALMQARNALLFSAPKLYNREGPEELLYNLQIFRKLHYDYGWFPESGENPCVQCGRCEEACSQNLKIIEGVADIYRRAEAIGYTVQARKERLRELLDGVRSRRIALYPNGSFSSMVISLCEEIYGESAFEWFLFNSNPELWGKEYNGRTIHAPEELREIRPELILICSYRFEKDIAESLRPFEKEGIRVEKLHRESDCPWVF